MAYVKTRFCKNAAEKLKYVSRVRGKDDVTGSESCQVETAAESFKTVRDLHHKDVVNECLHIMQSWSEEESKTKTPEEFNSIGRKLAEEKYPGHQFVIRTHTDKGHIHNHIVVNTVHIETGKRIKNKKSIIQEVRDHSDKLCRENGLSIIDGEGIQRRARLPFKVQQMVHFNKKSWVYDLVQKIDVARTYSTNFDEYVGVLSEMKIRTVVQNKNITYFYPDREKGKRGSKLGKLYDREGLEGQLRENRHTYALSPHLRENWKSKSTSTPKPTISNQPIKSVSYASDELLQMANAPMSEFRRARMSNILDYCRNNKIGTTKNEKGQTVLIDREHVVLSDYECRNMKNGTRGNLIDLVAIHKNVSFLQAVAHINNNPRLLLLEEALGTSKRTYTSFYIPKQNRLEITQALEHLGKWMASIGGDPKKNYSLLNSDQAQVSKEGTIRLFGKSDESGALEFTPQRSGQWSQSLVGKPKTPFYASGSSTREAVLFLNPVQFFKHAGNLFGNERDRHGILVLLEPDKKIIHAYLAEDKHISKLFLVPTHSTGMSAVELDLFNNLKHSYQNLGIQIEAVSPAVGIRKSIENCRSSGLSL